MGILAWVVMAILVVLSFVFLSIFGLVIVGIGLFLGYTDAGFKYSAIVTFVIYSIFFAVLVLLLAILTKFALFLLLLFIGIPVLYVIGLVVVLLFNFLAYKAAEVIAD